MFYNYPDTHWAAVLVIFGDDRDGDKRRIYLVYCDSLRNTQETSMIVQRCKNVINAVYKAQYPGSNPQFDYILLEPKLQLQRTLENEEDCGNDCAVHCAGYVLGFTMYLQSPEWTEESNYFHLPNIKEKLINDRLMTVNYLHASEIRKLAANQMQL